MRKTTRRTAALLATGALGLGGLAVAAPAVADVNLFTRPTTSATPDWRSGGGMGNRMGMGNQTGTGYQTGTGNQMGMGSQTRMGNQTGVGNRMGMGRCGNLAVTAASGTLTAAQKSTLAAMAEEEKLAHDLYTAFAAKYPAAVFDRIAAAETQHLTAVRTLLDRYGLTDPTLGTAAGQFSDSTTQATYDRLLARGSTSQAAALGVGKTVEQADIADLQAALRGLTAPDAQQVYRNLLSASQQHLTAFER